MRSLPVLLLLGACGATPPNTPKAPEAPKAAKVEPMRISKAADIHEENIGKRMTFIGQAADAKAGAMLNGVYFSIFIAGMSEWPTGFYQMNQPGKRVQVTGTLARDNGNPAFVARPGEPIKTGIPVATEAQAKAASQRWVLKDVTYVVLDPPSPGSISP